MVTGRSVGPGRADRWRFGYTSTMRPTLVSIPNSPWSIRAKLALDVMGVDVQVTPYTPIVSAPWLRWKLGRPAQRLTLPVLLRDGPAVTDSLEIAKWAAQRSAAPLITAENTGAVTHWNHIADQLMSAGRLRTTYRVLGDPEALHESLPRLIRPLGLTGRALGRMGAHLLLRKYANGAGAAAQPARMREALRTITEALADRETMLPSLSYADIVLAVALSFVQPHHSHDLGPRARRCWTADDLAREFAPLIAWRDSVYIRLDDLRAS